MSGVAEEAASVPDLTGVRLWLSASVPEDATPDEKERLLDFVQRLARETFRNNGHLVHGSHPSIVPILLQEAARFRDAAKRKPNLTFVVSRWFSKDAVANGIDRASWQTLADVRETPAGSDLDRSLAIMRDRLASQADVLVAVGGRWWQTSPQHTGVLGELRLATQRGIASFLLGGLGGAMQGFWRQHPEVLRQLKNGLDDGDNERLAAMTDVDELVGSVLRQTARLPLKRPETLGGEAFRILALDGGGIRGTYTAAVLAEWEARTGCRVAEHFDLIAGTSTGGILALGLGMGRTPAEMLELYRKDGPQIFPMTSFPERRWWNLWHWFAPKFDENVLRDVLTARFKNAPRGELLGKSICRLVIPVYDVTSDRVVVFRTPHSPGAKSHGDLPVAEAALATAAAPTYFNPAKIKNPVAEFLAVDGGIWANCPVMLAVAEALGVLGVPLDRIDVLSVGTTHTPFLQGRPFMQGKLGWAAKIAGLLMKAQSQATLHHAEQSLGARLLRVDCGNQSDALDDVNAIPRLVALGEESASRSLPEVSKRFLNGVCAGPW